MNSIGIEEYNHTQNKNVDQYTSNFLVGLTKAHVKTERISTKNCCRILDNFFLREQYNLLILSSTASVY